MTDLSVKIAGIAFKNPVILASGCVGFGLDYEELFPVSRMGGVSLKGTTLEPRGGNPPPRVAETPAGMLNSVGLQNPGVDAVIADYLPQLKNVDTVVIANIAGSTVEDYRAAVERICTAPRVDMVELNISCPNVKAGGVAFGISAAAAEEVVGAVRKVCTKPLMVKLTPNVTDITEVARAAEAAGADAVSLINTLLGMRIDVKSRRPVLRNNVGGLSGPAVFPVALRMVWQVAQAVSVPVVGMGGISRWEDAAQMLMAGATAVQIGAALFADPMTPLRVIAGLEDFLESAGEADIKNIIGTVRKWD